LLIRFETKKTYYDHSEWFLNKGTAFKVKLDDCFDRKETKYIFATEINRKENMIDEGYIVWPLPVQFLCK
jgi:hypothetical protein